VSLEGGVLAVTQDAAARLMPVCGWVLRDALPMMQAVIERMRADHQVTPAPVRDWREQIRVQGPAELVALYDQLDGAVLFADTGPWRLRSLDDRERIEVRLPDGRRDSILRLIDLPDGTYLALAETEPPVYVRGRAEALSPVPAQVEIIDGIRMPPEPRTTTESAADIEVVATSLTELLGRALDTHGRLEMPSQGRLNERIDARWLR
jgi:hypothetical protein